MSDDLVDRLTAMFAEVLGATGIGPDDDFFALGGHSLLVGRLLGRIKRELGVHVTAPAFFAGPSAGHLAVLIRDALAGGAEAATAVTTATGTRLGPGSSR